MKTVIAGLLLAALAASAGYWLGDQARLGTGATAPVGPPAQQTEQAQAGKQLLYYRNPMGLPDTSPTPKKDAMGMDYIPVYAGAEDDGASVKIGTAKVQKLGVRTEAAAVRDLARRVRAVGRVEVDERRVFAVAPRFEGWIERLHVNTAGQPVGRGQALFEVYSPELVSVQREYQVAVRAVEQLKDAAPEARANMRELAEASLARLANWDISPAQIARLKAGGEPSRTLTYRAPAAGVVLEKKVVQGMRFMPGDTLYQIADLSSVWVLADIFERDIGAVKLGQTVDVGIDAYPGKIFAGKLSYLYPTLNPQTRSVPVRIELPNPRGELRPAMYANVEIKTDAGGTTPAGKLGLTEGNPFSGTGGTAITVPVSAVIDGGAQQRVIVQQAEGRFEPRTVKLGRRGDDYVEVKEGIKEGELVVVAANFLIDSESNLKAALGGMAGGMQEANPKSAIAHPAVGVLESVDTHGGLLVTHEPVPSLNWPKMTMEFAPANAALAAGLRPGTAIRFEFVERKPGEWVIIKIEKAH